MTWLYPITRRQWLRNPEGLGNYVHDQESVAVTRINKQLSFLNKNQNVLLSDADIVNVTIKRNVYTNALLAKRLLLILLLLFVIAEWLLNYQNMEVWLFPGQEGLGPLLARVPTALILTGGSIYAADVVLEMMFHRMLENDKHRFNFPDTSVANDGIKGTRSDATRIGILLVSLGALIGLLYAIYLLSIGRASAFEGGGKAGGGLFASPLAIVALMLPPLGGLIFLFIKKHHNITVAYRAMMRYKMIQEGDRRRKNNLEDAFTLKKAKVLNQEIASTYRRINKLKNFMQARNSKSASSNGGAIRYMLDGIDNIEKLDSWKFRVRNSLEKETLREYDRNFNPNI